MESRNNILGMQNETLINDMGAKNGAPPVESPKNVKSLASDTIILDKEIILKLGKDAALIFAELLLEEEAEGDWFFSTVSDLEENTRLSKYKQKKALGELERYGFIQVKRAGICGKRQVKINKGGKTIIC